MLDNTPLYRSGGLAEDNPLELANNRADEPPLALEGTQPVPVSTRFLKSRRTGPGVATRSG
jgi:hypothetical protein